MPPTPDPTQKKKRRLITILHFNDVYNAENGAGARFVAALKTASALEPDGPPLVLFSGDALFPSNVSTVTLGKHMVPVLNLAGVACSCLGNHDVDGGVANFTLLPWSFPWLCSNADNAEDGEPFAGCRRSFVLDHAPSGLRVGLLGLIEPEWAATLPCVEEEDIVVKGFVEEGRRQARALREREKVDLVIALTHMRLPNDLRLAVECGGDIDAVLGGHDHDAAYEPGTAAVPAVDASAAADVAADQRVAPVVKSGSDFRTFSRLVLELPATSNQQAGAATTSATATVADYALLSVAKDAPEDPECAAAVSEFTSALEARMDDVVGRTLCDLDARFATVRSRESNLGDLVSDVFRRVLRSDAALLNSGTFRSDMIHPKGELTVRDLVTLFPLLDETAVVRVTGSQLLAALENGVSQWPRLEGRFPQVSGIRFAFDARLPAGKRVLRDSVEVAGAPLDDQRLYSLATKAFVSPEGKDGYDVLGGCAATRAPSSCPVLPVVMRSALHALGAVNSMRAPTAGVRAFAAKWRAAAAAKQSAANGGGSESREQQQQQQEVDYARHAMLGEGLVSADPLRGGQLAIDVKVDGRIRIVGEQEVLAAVAG